MAIFSVTYDLNTPGKDYKELRKFLESYGSFARPTKSQWLIETGDSCDQIIRDVMKHIDENDIALVVKLEKGASGFGIDSKVWKWIEARL